MSGSVIMGAANSSCLMPTLPGVLVLQDIAHDAVIAADGRTYERSAIEQWLRQPHTLGASPVTGSRMQRPLRSNFAYMSVVCSLIVASR